MSLYVKIDGACYQETGEIKITGRPVDTTDIMYEDLQRDIKNSGFAIHRPEWFYGLIEKIGGAKGKVVTSIMRKKGIDNNINATIADLIEWSGCSPKTVMDTIKLLRDNDMLKTRTGMMMLNPGVEHRGDRQRESTLLRLYSQFRTTNKSVGTKCKEEETKNG